MSNRPMPLRSQSFPAGHSNASTSQVPKGRHALVETVSFVLQSTGSMRDVEAIDLGVIAGELSPGEAFSIKFLRDGALDSGEAVSTMMISFSAGSLVPAARNEVTLRPTADAIKDALRAAFPGCLPVLACPDLAVSMERVGQSGLHQVPLPRRRVPLPPPAEISPLAQDRHVGDVLLNRTDHWPSLAMPGHAGGGIDLSEGLTGLISTGRSFMLSLTVTAMTLSPQERALAGRTARLLRGDAEALMRDPAGFGLRARDSHLLASWETSGAGWRFDVEIAVPAPMADRLFLLRALARRFGVVPDDPETAPVTLDLSSSLPRSQGLRGLLPPIGALKALGFLALGGSLLDSPAKPAAILRLGTDFSGLPITVPRADLGRHMVILGATGTGKSTLIRQMVRADLSENISGLVMEPAGDLVHDIVDSLSKVEREQVIIADLATDPESLGLDLLATHESDPARAARRVANDLTEIFQRVLFRESPESFGPMWSSYFANGLALLILGSHGQGRRPDLCDFSRVFHDTSFRKQLLANCSDSSVIGFWTGIALRAGGEASLENIAPYIVSKLDALTGNPILRKIVTGAGRPLDLGAAFDAGKTILINLAKGSLGASDAALVGALVTARVLRDLLARCERPRAMRRPVRITLDEFQTYATPGLAQLMAEGRKTGAEIVCCSQDLTSFGGSRPQPEVAGAILSNAAQLLAFRVGPRDAALLSEWFGSELQPAELMQLPDRVFAARLMSGGIPRRVRIGRTLDQT